LKFTHDNLTEMYNRAGDVIYAREFIHARVAGAALPERPDIEAYARDIVDALLLHMDPPAGAPEALMPYLAAEDAMQALFASSRQVEALLPVIGGVQAPVEPGERLTTLNLVTAAMAGCLRELEL
jgi:hypothetical protein